MFFTPLLGENISVLRIIVYVCRCKINHSRDEACLLLDRVSPDFFAPKQKKERFFCSSNKNVYLCKVIYYVEQ